jgi:Flp pilus assembly protein TadG
MTRTIRIPPLFHRCARAFLADAKGLAAVELAMILPLACMLMSLVVYGGQAYGVQRRVTLAATTVANIFAQANNNNQSTITAAELTQILAYPNLILYPYDASAVQVVVSQLLVTTSNGNVTGTVCTCPITGNSSAPCSWANANGTPLPVGTQLSLDPSIASAFSASGSNDNPACGNIPANSVPTNYVVLGQVSYPFQPTGIWFSVGQMTLHDSIYMIPRVASPITVE